MEGDLISSVVVKYVPKEALRLGEVVCEVPTIYAPLPAGQQAIRAEPDMSKGAVDLGTAFSVQILLPFLGLCCSVMG